MKRLLSVILAALLAASLLALPTQAAETGYNDIEPDAWYALCVADATKRGLMNGTGGGTFTPDGDLTRAMLVTVLWRLAGEPAAKNPAAFTDVPAGQWYSEAIAWASGFDVIEGYGGGVFGTDDPVTREQMAVIFYRWAQGQDYDVTIANSGAVAKEEADLKLQRWETDHYEQISAGKTISDWAVDAVVWSAEQCFLCRRGTSVDSEGRHTYSLCAPDAATRAETAVFLSRFCRVFSEEDRVTVPFTPKELGIVTLDLPETWNGGYETTAYVNYEGVPGGKTLLFWDRSNYSPWVPRGLLFQLNLWPERADAAGFGGWDTMEDAAPGRSGRICTIEVPGEGRLTLNVKYPQPEEDGVQYDPANPKNYERMRADIDSILRSVRFIEGVKVLYTAPAYQIGQ